MRDFLDAILEFIGSESLTDSEFESITLTGDPAYTKETYEALRTVLEARENVSGQTQRLKLYFQAKGVDMSATSALPTPNSNIFIGSAL
jgi:hypothetical protein